eukprot:3892514-Rhodomonas_salina.1
MQEPTLLGQILLRRWFMESGFGVWWQDVPVLTWGVPLSGALPEGIFRVASEKVGRICLRNGGEPTLK